MKKVLAIAASVLAVASVLVGLQITAPSADQPSASALSGSTFNAGNIISDANFYDGNAMSATAVQAFLDTQIGACASSSCLNVGRFSMNSRGSDPMCSALSGGTSLSAAVIITRVATACGISPKVIMVTLQKEQTLINGGVARNPSAARLERAMGYACPDNVGGHCDPAYAGVGNQIYWSAWQWKRYGNPAGTSNYFTWFNPGGNRAIQYNVPVSCGTKSVPVQNKATAALYYYTPYTPNTAALSNLYGTGDSCSAYGNRNFWRLYTDWFGSTTGATTTAKGNLDAVTATYNAITVSGWALDTTTTASTRVVVTVAGASTSIAANATRADVGSAYGLGSKHGFSRTISAHSGTQQVCVVAKSANGKTSADLGCKTVTIADGSPFGTLDSATANQGGTLSVRGWAIDPETASSIGVRVYVDGKYVTRVAANQARSDVAAAYPKSGAAHGYATTFAATAGSHQICVRGVNVKAGSDKQVGSCKRLTVAGSNPVGAITAIATTSSSIRVQGWAIDGDRLDPIAVWVSIDGQRHGIMADRARQSVATTYPAWGASHGFSGTWKASIGKHEVCVTARNVGAGTGDVSVGCKTVAVTNARPIGSLDAVKGVSGGVQVSGWALDQDTPAVSIPVDVYVDSVGKRVTATRARVDVGSAHAGAGDLHGYSLKLPAKAGSHKVCAYAIDSQDGPNATLGCTTVTTPK
ncbi:hypothetical protein BIU98_13595 [Curtobacterium sp. MMLR14_010]|uniref:hypothetical protein n=1 Tax=Curtobacterium sp. MMLR14_010 TaxID=1898743 RepID=UPI0008DDD52E|nr:hypothetical protein [Curtobacterium sp. MMLR14_010]OII38471.1 hypothetical protein BIU98_13595 [Curtobacterium sp. MMLR14_010]